jgi:hypothetical protein
VGGIHPAEQRDHGLALVTVAEHLRRGRFLAMQIGDDALMLPVAGLERPGNGNGNGDRATIGWQGVGGGCRYLPAWPISAVSVELVAQRRSEVCPSSQPTSAQLNLSQLLLRLRHGPSALPLLEIEAG